MKVNKFEKFIKENQEEHKSYSESDSEDDLTNDIKNLFEDSGFWHCGVKYNEDGNIVVRANTPLNLKDVWNKNLDKSIDKLLFMKRINEIALSVREFCLTGDLKRVMLYTFKPEDTKKILRNETN